MQAMMVQDGLQFRAEGQSMYGTKAVQDITISHICKASDGKTPHERR